MAAILPSKLFSMAKATDPKQAIFEALDNAQDKIRVMNNQLLVATYIAPEVMSNIKKDDGTIVQLVRVNSSQTEDLYMGCMGLVVKKGPVAFKDDDRLKIFWDGQDIQVGEWVMFRYSSGWEQHVNGVSVRFVEDRDIKAIVDDPAIIISKPTITLA